MTPDRDQPLRILLVEDSPSDAALLEVTLTAGPGQVTVVNAETLQEAIALAQEQPFDAILLDLTLPDSHGLETVVRARAVWPALPIVVLTGASDERLGLEAVRNGMQDYLIKSQAGGPLIARSLHYAIERKRYEREILRMNAELDQRVNERTAQLHQLALKLTLVEQDERRRLAELLHDNLQQLLVYSRLTVGEALSSALEARLRPSLERVERTLAEAIEVTRSLNAELSPPLLYERGLVAAVRWVSDHLKERAGLTVQVRPGADAEPRLEIVRVLLFLSVRELLANVVKHSGVREAVVEIDRTDGGEILITVCDSGRGCDPGSEYGTDAGGFGLFSIRERLRQLGGALEIACAPGQGTCVTLRVPDDAAHVPTTPAPVLPSASPA